ncbi:MAG: Crp/Fnr family transcriptional regulator [Lachnospiraceae bacterium]|nr:Crp/Fnr family transcriptional regulator [Lachnospiraceae bacterium]
MQIPTFYYQQIYNPFREIFHDNRDGEKHLDKGELVQTLSNNHQTIYHYIRRGSVSLSITTEEGYRKMLLLCGENMIFPIYRDGADYKTNHTIEFQVRENLTADILYESHLRQLLLAHPDFLMRTLNVALDVLDLYTYDAANSSYNDSFVSVCNLLYLLWKQMPETGSPKKLPVSHSDISYATGYSRPQVSKQINRLSRENIVATGYNSLTILDARRLAEYCSYDVREE